MRDSLDISEVRTQTNQTFGLHSHWRLSQTSEDEAESERPLREVTIENALWDRRENIWVRGGSNFTESFYIGTERDVSQIDWNSGLFRRGTTQTRTGLKCDYNSRSIKMERGGFCVRCVEENSNRCRRLSHKMIEENTERKLTLCSEEIQAGEWSGWTDLQSQPCLGLDTVEGINCGPGNRTQSRTCTRELGGQFCRDQDGKEVEEDLEFRLTECFKGDCPGITLRRGEPSLRLYSII